LSRFLFCAQGTAVATILVIDDREDLRETIRLVLETRDHKVIEATNGREGLKAFAEFAPDVVITDVIMPETDGIEFIRELRKRNPAAKVIAVTGYVAPDFLRIMGHLGAVRSLTKPFAPEALLEAVESTLAGQPVG
jgi:CheY-like chemotaxis protein